eukprot:2015731-Prymnesium_polylepis.1
MIHREYALRRGHLDRFGRLLLHQSQTSTSRASRSSRASTSPSESTSHHPGHRRPVAVGTIRNPRGV